MGAGRKRGGGGGGPGKRKVLRRAYGREGGSNARQKVGDKIASERTTLSLMVRARQGARRTRRRNGAVKSGSRGCGGTGDGKGRERKDEGMGMGGRGGAREGGKHGGIGSDKSAQSRPSAAVPLTISWVPFTVVSVDMKSPSWLRIASCWFSHRESSSPILPMSVPRPREVPRSRRELCLPRRGYEAPLWPLPTPWVRGAPGCCHDRGRRVEEATPQSGGGVCSGCLRRHLGVWGVLPGLAAEELGPQTPTV